MIPSTARLPFPILAALALGSLATAQQVRRFPSGPQDVYPTTGGPGTQVGLHVNVGAGLAGSHDPEDVIVRGELEGALLGRCTSLRPNQATVRVGKTDVYTHSTRLELVFGSGHEFPLPSLDGLVTHDGPGYVWSAPLGAPIVTSGDEFVTRGLSVDLPCDAPPTTITQPFRLDADGCLRAQLVGSGACTGDKLSVTLDLDTTSQMGVISIPPTSPLTAQSWGTAAFYLTFQMATPLAPFDCTVTYDPATRQIVVCPNMGTTITRVGPLSGVTIELDPAQHTEFVDIKGDVDDFNFLELEDFTSPEASFDAWLQDFWAPTHGTLHPALGYDLGICDTWLWDSIPGVLSSGYLGEKTVDGEIRSAVLQVHIRGYGCSTETDLILLGWNGAPDAPSFEWGTSMISLSDLSLQWQPDDEAVLCFDLSALPRPDGSRWSILDTLAVRDVLDLHISDDTEIDYVELKVLRCNP